MKNLWDAFDWWFTEDAEYWQFWMPQSGPIGGLIFAGVLGVLLVIALALHL